MSTLNETIYFLGVDVGTGSTRAALFTQNGNIVQSSTSPIKTWNPKFGYFNQSSIDIWNACIRVIKDVVRGVDPRNIKGMGFDATCSLVVLNKDGLPLPVCPDSDSDQNIILWMDHRAHEEADFINQTNHSVLRSAGGKISLEMEIPKLLWLKKNMRDTYDNAGYFFDLPDFLTWQASGADSRSLCSVVCKWTYEANNKGNIGWNAEFFKQIGLDDLLQSNNFKKIGYKMLAPGTPCGNGLTDKVAKLLGLLPGTAVGTSMIDAHAGGLGLIGCNVPGFTLDFGSRLGLICGTSTCHMAVSKEAVFVPGVWGPYWSAMVPEMWLSEGGQSSTGKLIDHIIETHPAYKSIKSKLDENTIVVNYLNTILERMTKEKNLECVDMLTSDLHVWPDFHGNRSPLANPTLRGMISGLTLSHDEESLALLYLATIQALSYGTLHIIEALENAGHSKMSCVLVCGGLSKNLLFLNTQANVIGRPVLLPSQKESVLCGAAMLGACASGVYPTVVDAIEGMAGDAQLIPPNNLTIQYHLKKYKVFLRMIADQEAYRKIMQ
uniref:FGGY carbohydrate kinase domain-containing protein n=1 Tax=Clastoptera arizonana TaxID=38151 RepID=A0A1B6DV82_9HEMI